ncbi:hypothetical protein AVEN_112032-1 [Araneus ventricosus]|uniref:Uncharacterized protein n=1 Tax=Araneus ventricosus TaxID=182803 RepID=A0A4Y2QQH0_ARAVE|nr:hypothetical protein AVEN_112032-1 [Araneus ventricosus]
MDALPVYDSIYTEFGFESPYLWNRWGDRLENCTHVSGKSFNFEPYHFFEFRTIRKFRDSFSAYQVSLDTSSRLYSTRRIDRHLTRPICLVNGSTSGLRFNIYGFRLWEESRNRWGDRLENCTT